MQSMEELHAAIRLAQGRFADLIRGLSGKPVDLERYSRYLTMQYHLTKGVQRYFFGIAAHPSLARRRRLRSFLVRFVNEEELHYLVAGNDLAKVGEDVGPCPLDVSVWHPRARVSMLRTRLRVRDNDLGISASNCATKILD